MTPHLHPRSRLTSSLFGATLAVSFLVVAMPHIVPCPAPRVRFADSEFEVLEDGRRRRIQRQEPSTMGEDTDKGLKGLQTASLLSEEEEAVMRKAAHECPMPKPRGILGELLGFTRSEIGQSKTDGKIEAPRIEIQRKN